MEPSLDFKEFYDLLEKVKFGDKINEAELNELLEDYKDPKDCSNCFEELGKVYCSIGIDKIKDYTGFKQILKIRSITDEIWNYLDEREGFSVGEYLKKEIILHTEENNLCYEISNKWGLEQSEIEINIKGLSEYIVDGIVGIIK